MDTHQFGQLCRTLENIHMGKVGQRSTKVCRTQFGQIDESQPKVPQRDGRY